MFCRQAYISNTLFYISTIALLLYLVYVLLADARHKGVSFPLGPFQQLLHGTGGAAGSSAALA